MDRPTIVTNMTFWQSPVWARRTLSIYPMAGRRADPAPMSWWREARALFRRRGLYDVVLTMGDRTSLAYGLLCALTGSPSRQVLCEVFIDDPAGKGSLWKAKTALFRLVASRAIGLLTNSSAEVRTNAERFRLPADRIRFVPLNTTIERPECSPLDDGFVLCAGRTLRDYPTLLKAASLFGAPLVVVCGRDDLPPGTVPEGVRIEREVTRERYLDLLRRCRAVALPLRATQRATGQLVLLEAMSCGKPVVTTRAPGTTDYVRDGETGWLVEVGDAETLGTRVRALVADPERARRMGRAALDHILAHHQAEQHASDKIAAITALWQAVQP